MRILHITDTHLGRRLPVRGAPNGWSRHQDHLDAMLAALEPARQGLVDLVVHTGDVFDRSRPPPAVALAATSALRAVARRVPVVVLAGNHDRSGVGRSLGWGAPGLTVVDHPTRLVVGDVALAAVPFTRGASAWAEAARLAVGAGADALLTHQAFHGESVPGLRFEAGVQADTIGARHLPPGTRWVLSGHVHPRQVTRVGDAVVVQPGSTERTAWSEASATKGYAVWELGRTVRWRFVDLAARPLLWAADLADLAAIQPGTLVRIHASVGIDQRYALEQAVLGRGGWLVGFERRLHRDVAAGPQQRLFGG